MSNLQHVSPKLRKDIENLFADPSIHNFAKNIIHQGLNIDCLDAWRDAQLAADLLQKVEKEIVSEQLSPPSILTGLMDSRDFGG